MNKKTSISDIQIFKKSVGQAEAGENVGINIKDAPIHTLKRGMMLAKVNSFQPTNHFEGTAYFLTKVIIVYLKHFNHIFYKLGNLWTTLSYNSLITYYFFKHRKKVVDLSR